jgi:hypothetical protein
MRGCYWNTFIETERRYEKPKRNLSLENRFNVRFRFRVWFVKDLSSRWANNPTTFFIIVIFKQQKSQLFIFKRSANHCFKSESNTQLPVGTITLYYYFGKPCTCGFTTSTVKLLARIKFHLLSTFFGLTNTL